MATELGQKFKEKCDQVREVMNTQNLNEFCPVCKDTHFIRVDNCVTVCPECFQRRIVEQLLRYSEVPVECHSDCFDSFLPIPGTEQSLGLAKAICNPDDPTILGIIYGQPGNGKTRLCYAGVMESINNGKPAKFKRCLDLLGELKNAFRSQFGPNFDEVFGWYQLAQVLFLDELDWRTEFDQQTLDDLICWRFEHNKPTLITTNRNATDIQETFPRITSRASDPEKGRMVLNKASDYRRRKTDA